VHLRLVGQIRLVGQLYFVMRSISMRFRQLLLIGQLSPDGSSESVSRRTAPPRRQLRLVMRSMGMQFGQLLLVGQLRLDGSSESAAQGISTSEFRCGRRLLITKRQKAPSHYRYLNLGPLLHSVGGIEWCSVLRLLVFLCILRFRIFEFCVLNASELELF